MDREERGAGPGGQCHQGLWPRSQAMGRGREAGGDQGDQAEPRGQDRVHVQPQEAEHCQGERAGEIRSKRQEISIHGHSEQEKTR